MAVMEPLHDEEFWLPDGPGSRMDVSQGHSIHSARLPKTSLQIPLQHRKYNIGLKLSMKCHQWLVFCASAVTVLVSSCNSTLTTPSKSVVPKSDPISDQVHVSINNYRTSLEKKPLTRHAGLDQLASQHSRFLLLNSGNFSVHGKKVSHYGFENRVLIARRMYSMDTMGENVAAGRVGTSHPGDGLLKLWRNSKDHHKQLLEDWTHTGIGAVMGGDGTVYCTQLFATRNISRQQSRDRFIPR
jgi:uncharacterized protein YkwD